MSDKKIEPVADENKVDVTADMAAMFEGADLTEEFKTKATEIFKAALASKLNEEIELATAKSKADADAAHAELVESLENQLNDYLDYVVEQWMEDNKLSIEAGLKSQMTEEFLKGLKTLFTEHYVDLPEDKVDIVEEMTSKIESLEASLNAEITKNIDLKKQVSDFERNIAVVEVSEGLTETQVAKLESLSEAIEDCDIERFKKKLKTLRENYFPETKPSTSVADVALDDEPIADDDHAEKLIDPAMKNYVSAISRSLKK